MSKGLNCVPLFLGHTIGPKYEIEKVISRPQKSPVNSE